MDRPTRTKMKSESIFFVLFIALTRILASALGPGYSGGGGGGIQTEPIEDDQKAWQFSCAVC